LTSSLELLQSPRVGGEASLSYRLMHSSPLAPGDGNYYASLVLRGFGNDLLGTGSEFRGWQNYLEAPMHYCGLLTLLLAPQVWIHSTRTQRIVVGAAAGVLLISHLFPWFRYAFWLFTGDYFRTLSLFATIVLLCFSVRALDGIVRHGGLHPGLLGGTLVVLLVL